MIINYLYIKDFKNIKEIILNLINKKIILLLGETGNGKSSVFDALTYVLTDHLDEKIIEYVRWGCKEFIINCNFIHQNNEYDISIIGGKTTKKKLVINKTDEYLNSEATKKLAEIIDPVLTKYSSISTQGQSTQLLFDTPANRLKKLREILKIEKTIEASELIKEDIKSNKDKIDKIQLEISAFENIKYVYMDLPEIKNIDILQSQFEDLEIKKQFYDKNIVIYNQYLNDKDKYIQACEKIKNLNIKIENNNKEKLSLKSHYIDSYDFDDKEYQKIIEQLSHLKIELNDFNNKVDAYKKYELNLNKLQIDIDNYNRDLSEIKIQRIKPLIYTDMQLKDVQNKIKTYALHINILKNKIDLAKKGKCPTCEQDYIIDVNELNKKYNEVLLLHEENTALETLYYEDKQRFEKESKEQDQLKNKKQSIQDKIDMVQNQIESLSKIDKPIDRDYITNIKKLETEKIRLEKLKVTKDETDKHNSQIDLKINSIDIQNKEYLIQLNDLSINEPEEITKPEFDNILYESIKNEILLNNQKQDEYDRVIKFNKELKKNEDETKEKILFLTDSIQKYRLDIRILEESKNILEKQFSGFLIDKGTNFIKNKMNDFFAKSYGKYNITLGQDRNSIDFFYTDGVNKLAPCSMASGFEKQIISISNRVALCSLQSLGILMLDEADSESSTLRSEVMFRNLLNEKSFNQFFIITHKDSTQEMIMNTNNSMVCEIKNGELVN